VGPHVQRMQFRLSAGSLGSPGGGAGARLCPRKLSVRCRYQLGETFDRVNHDRLIAAVVARVSDRQVLLLIRGYLTTGVLDGGLLTESREGTPQGGPLSPLLSNLVLNELHRELERRGHRFVRYADDCNIYVLAKRPAGGS
jgi:hypothetical protein